MDHKSWKKEQALGWADALDTGVKIASSTAKVIARNLRFAVERIEAQEQRIEALETAAKAVLYDYVSSGKDQNNSLVRTILLKDLQAVLRDTPENE